MIVEAHVPIPAMVAPRAMTVRSRRFDEVFDAELADDLGDLGPAAKTSRGGRGRRR